MWHLQLRWKVVHARFEGQQWKTIAERFTISIVTCKRYWRLYLDFGTPEGQKGRRRRGLLNDADDAMLLTIIDRDPTLYLDELAEEMALVLNKAVRVHHVLRACKVCWLAFCSRVSSS